MDLFNLWDLERVNIKPSMLILERINKEIFSKFKIKREAYKNIFRNNEIPWRTFKNILKKSYVRDFFVPLGIYLKIIKNLEISNQELQKNILAYKTAKGVNFIENPILPIKITPIFDMLFAHHIGDGTVINPGNERLPYFGYRQINNFYRLQYVRLLESVFGKINFKKNYLNKSTRPYCPPVLSSLFFKYYKTDKKSFLSKKARIPEKIFLRGKESLVSMLIGMIIDDGHIDSTQMTIAIKNKPLIKDLYNICLKLGYESKITKRKGDYIEYSYLHILRKGMKKFYRDYKLLKEKYPAIDLGWKGEKIKNSFKIYSRKIYKTKGNQKIIFEILKKEKLTVNQIAERLNMTRQGVRFHIHNLIKVNKIKLLDKTNPNWIYGT